MADRETLNQFQLIALIDRLAPRRSPEVRFAARRPDDHLVFDLLFDNLHVETGQNPARLTRADAARRGVLIVEFPPQSFGEEAFQKASRLNPRSLEDLPPNARTGVRAGKYWPPPAAAAGVRLPARVRMSGPSRLAFTMPAGVDAIPFTLPAVLDAMREWPMRLDVNAVPDVPVLMGGLERTFEMVRDAIASSVGARGGADVTAALESGARRIAEVAAGGLNPSGAEEISSVMWAGIRRESTRLVDQFPQLRVADLHTATLAALAIGSSATLAGIADAAGVAADEHLAEQLPYLPLIFGTPHEPGQSATALELPYRVVLSPIGDARWQHASLPVARGARTELWHTRLSTPRGSGAEGPAQVRALWSPDYERAGTDGASFTTSLDGQDRQFLVKLMADWTQPSPVSRFAFQPRPSTAHRLHLSSLGALLDAEGAWDRRPTGVDLEQWRHVATLGRDHYVKVVYAGFLLPFGHAASLIKVTERSFESVGGNPAERTALLRQRFFVLVKEQVRLYGPLRPQHQLEGRNFPFNEVEILTRVTPELFPPTGEMSIIAPMQLALSQSPGVTDRMAFWPQVDDAGGKRVEFRFEVTASDRTGTRVTFSLPMLFVSELVNASPAPPPQESVVREAYSFADLLLRTAELNGAEITYDLDPATDPAKSRLPTASLTFSTEHIFPFDHATSRAAPLLPLDPNFFPEVEAASVNVPALQKLLGRNVPFDMTYPKVDSAAEFDNPGGVFLWAKAANTLDFGGGSKAQTDALGGLASPVMPIIGLSSVAGPVSGDDKVGIAKAIKTVAGNTFEPATFFGDAKLLGGIKLAEIVAPVLALGLRAAPRFLVTEEGTATVTTFEWETDVRSSPGSKPLFVPDADHTSSSRLKMRGKVVTPRDPLVAATREAFATLNNFKLNLFGCIILWFDQLTFDMQPGQKPDVTVQLHAGDKAVVFGGPLEFVNELRRFIPSNGFSDPPALTVTPSGISAGYSLGLPVMAVGIFSLSNVSLGAAFTLPFDGRPISVRFNFSERQSPFSLIVSGLGGGGFFAIAIGANGVQEIEAALEFGAAIAINLGVASGSVEIKAGVYFHWKDDGDKSTVIIAGYVRIHGELTVLCLISASLTFNLQIGYQKVKDSSGGTSMIFGEAELIVEIEVLFLSFDVAVRCRREFAGGPADPKFIDLIPDAAVWSDYCDAFAAEAP